MLAANNYHLGALSKNDIGHFVFFMKNKEIYDNTLTVPFPYTEEHAVKFIEQHQDSKLDFAIRNIMGELVGCIGATQSKNQPHIASLGYWLAKPYWGKGIMTDVVRVFSDYLFKEFPELSRITANCFEHNIGSARVLEKSGFTLEGLAIKHYKKDGAFYNAKLYGRVL